MRTIRILSTLLATTALSTTVYGMESKILSEMEGFKTMDPSRSFNSLLLSNAYSDTLAGMSKDIKEFKDTAKKALNGDWASLAGVGIHQVIDHLNGQFLSRYNIAQNSDGEFNHESLKPFLKSFREKVTFLLHGLLSQSGNDYALNRTTGERYPIFNDTPFKQFAEACIPEYIPMKSLFVSICNTGPINDFLADKLDALALDCLFRLYKNQTGKTVKTTVIPFILYTLKKGASTSYSLATTDYDNHELLPDLTKKQLDIDQAYSPVFQYLKPRFAHLARQALSSMFLDVGHCVTELLIDKGLKATFDNSLVANGAKAMTLGLTAVTANIGWVAGGLFGGVVGGLSAPIFGGGIGWSLAYKYGWQSLAPLGMVLGGLVGLAPGLGSSAGFLMGPAIGATITGVATYTWTPRIITHMAKSMTQTTKHELNCKLQLLIDYNTYKLLPLTEDEHVLFNLNPDPTSEEKSVNSSDYTRREQLLSQSFAGEFIKQFIDNNGDLVKNIKLTLSEITDNYYSFVNYCLYSKDATVTEILEKAKLKDSPLMVGTVTGADKIWREFVLRTTGVTKTQEAEKSQDKKLQENLVKYPSFKVKEQYLKQLSLYMHSLSEHDLREFSENVHEVKEKTKIEEKRVQDIYKAVQTSGNRIAEIWQVKGNTLDENKIRAIQDSANELWETATAVQLELLAEVLHYDNKFISNNFDTDVIEPAIDHNYLKNILNGYIEKRDAIFLQEKNNQHYCNILKRSSLTEGLEYADVVDLLRKIKQFNLQNLPAEIQYLFNQDVNENVESKEKHVISITSSTSSEILKQKEIELIRDKYEFLLSRNLTVLFSRDFQARFESKGLAIGKKILEDNKTIADKKLCDKILSELSDDALFRDFFNQMEKHSRYKLFEGDIFSEIKTYISKITNTLNDASRSNFEVLTFPESTVSTEITALKLYDEYDVAASNLMDIINNSSAKKIDELESEDFEKIYEIIKKKKKESLTTDDLTFLQDYENEIAIFKMKQKNLENKLFYGYKEIIREIRKGNQQILGLIQNFKE